MRTDRLFELKNIYFADLQYYGRYIILNSHLLNGGIPMIDLNKIHGCIWVKHDDAYGRLVFLQGFFVVFPVVVTFLSDYLRFCSFLCIFARRIFLCYPASSG